MALNSTLGSPGIEIREIDNSIRLDASTATTVFVPGFASQGPVEEVMPIGSLDDFELIYGKPTNGAERYFYYTVKALLDKGGSGVKVLTSRLPYGAGAGDSVTDAYTLLAYPAIPVIKSNSGRETDCFITDGDTLSKDNFALKKYTRSSFYHIDNVTKEEKLIEELDTLSSEDEGVVATINVEKSSYEVFIEEDFLNENGFDMEKYKFALGFEEVEVPSLFATKSSSPVIKLSCMSPSEDEDGNETFTEVYLKNEFNKDIVFDSKGNLAVESLNGEFVIHIAYSIYDQSDMQTSIGYVVFKLVYVLSENNKFKMEELSQVA